jgi:hypothetical protein
VRVARPPSLGGHVGHAAEPQRQLPLSRLDPHGLPERLVFEPARHVHDDLAARQPSLAGAVDVRIAALPQPDVAADVVMPAVQILRDVIVVAVRLVGNPRGRTEMDPARHRPSGRLVHDPDVDPVAAAFRQLERDLAGLRPPVAFHVAPAHPAELVAAPPHRDGGRRQRGDRRVCGRSFRRSPASSVVRAGQRLRVSSDAPVHVDVEDPAPPVLRHQPHRTRWLADERVLIDVAGRDAGHDEPRAARHELDPLDRPFRMRILPAPQVVPGGPSHVVLRQPLPGCSPLALEPRQVVVAGVGDGEERQVAPLRRHHLDLEPLPDGHGDGLAAGQVKDILRDGLPDGVTGWRTRFEQPVRDDHPRRQPADPDGRSRPPPGRRAAGSTAPPTPPRTRSGTAGHAGPPDRAGHRPARHQDPSRRRCRQPTGPRAHSSACVRW